MTDPITERLDDAPNGSGFGPSDEQIVEALQFARSGGCSSTAIREWCEEPCGKTVVALTAQVWDGEPSVWATCAYHTRKGTAVPLVRILDALAAQAQR